MPTSKSTRKKPARSTPQKPKQSQSIPKSKGAYKSKSSTRAWAEWRDKQNANRMPDDLLAAMVLAAGADANIPSDPAVVRYDSVRHGKTELTDEWQRGDDARPPQHPG